MRYNITISGMGCSHCVERVKKALRAIGAEVLSVEINSAILDFGDDPGLIVKAVEELGFSVVSVEAE